MKPESDRYFNKKNKHYFWGRYYEIYFEIIKKLIDNRIHVIYFVTQILFLVFCIYVFRRFSIFRSSGVNFDQINLTESFLLSSLVLAYILIFCLPFITNTFTAREERFFRKKRLEAFSYGDRLENLIRATMKTEDCSVEEILEYDRNLGTNREIEASIGSKTLHSLIISNRKETEKNSPVMVWEIYDAFLESKKLTNYLR